MLLENISKLDSKKDKKDISQVKESFKNLRANLMFAMAGKKEKSKIILVTSGEPGEGKSTICVNLASSYADSNARVLVIDADLRKPKIDKYVCADKKCCGLSDYLGGFSTLEEIIVRPEGLNFDCIFSGRIPPNPSELLMIDEVENMFNLLAEKYDYIFIDTPPVGLVSETIYLTKFVTGVVFVVKKGKTHLHTTKEAISLLKFAQANVLGFVINNAYDINAGKYYYRRKKYYYYE